MILVIRTLCAVLLDTFRDSINLSQLTYLELTYLVSEMGFSGLEVDVVGLEMDCWEH